MPPASAGPGAARTSGQERFSESQAQESIRAERARYAAEQSSALAADRSRRDATRSVESARYRTRLATLRQEIRGLSQKLDLGRIMEPSEPLIFSASFSTEQSVIDYVAECRKWGEEQRAIRTKMFALEDEAAAIEGRDLASYSSAMSDLNRQIALHNAVEPFDYDGGLSNDSEVGVYRRVVRAVKLEQWREEAGLLQARREALFSRPTIRAGPAAESASESADLAAGPWVFERCVDGDTIEISIGTSGPREKVRLLCIDTPETGQAGYAQATVALRELLQFSTLELEFENPGNPTRDRYGRVLAYVFVGGKLANYELVKQGWSDFYTDYGRGRYATCFEFAQADAKANRRGLHH